MTMLFYCLLLVGVVAIGIPLCRSKYGKAIYCVLAGITLFMVAAIRKGVGYDYFSYAKIYYDTMVSNIDTISVAKNEKGILMPIKLLTYLTDEYQILFIICAFTIAAIVMVYLYRNSNRPWIGVFCFLTFGIFFNSMDFLRQMIAACVLIIATGFIKKKSPFKFIATVLFASTFHLSALFFLPFYLILKIKMNWITLGIYSAVTAVIYIFSSEIMGLVTKYVYTSYNRVEYVEVSKGTNPIYAIYFGIFFILAFWVRKELVKKDPFNNALIGCMFFTFFFEFMGTHHAILSRLAVLFFMPALILLVPRTIEVIVEKIQEKFSKSRNAAIALKITAITVFAAICCGMYTYMIANNYNGISPYRTIYTEVTEVDKQ